MNRKRVAFTLIELLIVIAIIAILALIAIPNFLEAQTRAKVSRVKADMRSVATALEAYFVDHNTYPMPRMGLKSSNPHIAWENDYAGHQNYLWFVLHIDGNPGATTFNNATRCKALTTPIAYLTSPPPEDPFAVPHPNEGTSAWHMRNLSYMYYNFLTAAKYSETFTNGYPMTAPVPVTFDAPKEDGGRVHNAYWAMVSAGPSRLFEYDDPNLTTTHVSAWQFLSNERRYEQLKGGGPRVYDPTNGTTSIGGIWRLSGDAVE